MLPHPFLDPSRLSYSMSSTVDSTRTTTNRRTEEDSDDLQVDLDDGASAQGGEADEEAEAAELAAMKARGEFEFVPVAHSYAC